MKKWLLIFGAIIFMSGNAIASDVQYNMRIEGITCSFCVATSAKALKNLEGVKEVSSDLEKGIIKVCANEAVKFTDEQLTKLFTKKGFSYRSMEKQESCDPV